MRQLTDVSEYVVVILAVAAGPVFLGACLGEDPESGQAVGIGADGGAMAEVNYFVDWDLGDDGYLAFGEFDAGIADTAPWWKGWDTDGDGGLDRDEFDTAFSGYDWYDAGLHDAWDVGDDALLTDAEWERGLFDAWDLDDDERLAETEFDSGLFDGGSP